MGFFFKRVKFIRRAGLLLKHPINDYFNPPKNRRISLDRVGKHQLDEKTMYTKNKKIKKTSKK